MSTPDLPYPDLLGPDAAPERRRLVADLDRVCAASRLDADRDRAIARLLHDHATAKNRQTRSANCPLRTPVTHWDRRSPCGHVCGHAVCPPQAGVPRRRAAGTAAVPVKTPVVDFSRALDRQMEARDNDGRVLPVWVRRHRALAAVAMLAVVIVLGGTFAALRGHASVDPARPLSSPLTSTAAASLGGRSTTAMTTISMQPSLATSTLVSGMSRALAPPSGMSRAPATTATPVSTPTGVFSPSPTS